MRGANKRHELRQSYKLNDLKIKYNKSILQEYTGPGGAETAVEKPSKDEIAVAKWLKRNVPTKKTKFLNHNVEYFTGSLAIFMHI